LVENYKFSRDTYVDFLYTEDKGNNMLPSDGTHLPCCMSSYPKHHKLGNFAVGIKK
jgi:hypothetical protein